MKRYLFTLIICSFGSENDVQINSFNQCLNRIWRSVLECSQKFASLQFRWVNVFKTFLSMKFLFLKQNNHSKKNRLHYRVTETNFLVLGNRVQLESNSFLPQTFITFKSYDLEVMMGNVNPPFPSKKSFFQIDLFTSRFNITKIGQIIRFYHIIRRQF